MWGVVVLRLGCTLRLSCALRLYGPELRPIALLRRYQSLRSDLWLGLGFRV